MPTPPLILLGRLIILCREHLSRLGPATFIMYDASRPKSISGTGHFIKRRQAEENLKKALELVQESEHTLDITGGIRHFL